MSGADEVGASDVSRETRERLEVLVAELARWQRVKNLVSPRTLDEVWTRHVADSLQLLPLAPGARRWLDLGSGAGFPGLVLAIAGDVPVTLVESDGRKCAFLREAARLCAAPARVVQARVEAAVPALAADGATRPDVVCARALAPLATLLAWSAPLLTAGALGLFPKGRDVDAELTQARRHWTFAADLVPSRTDSGGRIIRITHLSGPAT